MKVFEEQAKRMRESIREELETWERSIGTKKRVWRNWQTHGSQKPGVVGSTPTSRTKFKRGS